jgi:hypothetical protein
MKGTSVIRSPLRRVVALCLALATSLLAGLALASPANATAYRYWSYWQGASGEWVAAQTGPGDYVLVDQDVQGWRYAISSESVTVAPDNTPGFASLCPDLASGNAPAGQVRIAVVIDSGYVADAPTGQTPPADVVTCVTVPEGSTGNQALAAAGSISQDKGMVCSINGYPTGSCGASVSDAEAATAAAAAAAESANPAAITSAVAADQATAEDPATAETTRASNALGFALGGLLLALLIGAAFAIPALRRRSRTDVGA